MEQQQLTAVKDPDFVDRRQRGTNSESAGFERRQFRDGNRSARPEVAEFADATDE